MIRSGSFFREDKADVYGIDFVSDLGMETGAASNVRDLWAHKDLGKMSGSYSVQLEPHSCVVLRIKPKGKQRLQAEFASVRSGASTSIF